MNPNREYEVAIVGGGLAGLSAAILLSKQGRSVLLIEKEKYPFHKVCGEYISLESWGFLQQLGLPLQQMQLPLINSLFLTAPNGRSFTTPLPLGGFGISRKKLDHSLAKIAEQNEVHLLEQTRVDEIRFEEQFQIHFSSKLTPIKTVSSKICCAAFGKRSNLDVKWNRAFLKEQDKRLDNYVGIKYHIKTQWENNVIGLHNFENGYCGISKIEDDKYCLCYMTRSDNLKKCNNNILELEKLILSRNPHLKEIFQNNQVCEGFPITISQISFSKKSQVEDHILMMGDAAGMITPLCGNGMSIALHSGKLASVLINNFLEEKISRQELEGFYQLQWSENFAKRLRTGRLLQRFFGSNILSNFFVQTFKTFPFLAEPLVKMTHGKPF